MTPSWFYSDISRVCGNTFSILIFGLQFKIKIDFSQKRTVFHISINQSPNQNQGYDIFNIFPHYLGWRWRHKGHDSKFHGLNPFLCLQKYMLRSSNGNFFALLALCAGNSQVTGEFPSQRPVDSMRPSDTYASVKHTNCGSDNGLSPLRRQSIIWTNAAILSLDPKEHISLKLNLKI